MSIEWIPPSLFFHPRNGDLLLAMTLGGRFLFTWTLVYLYHPSIFDFFGFEDCDSIMGASKSDLENVMPILLFR